MKKLLCIIMLSVLICVSIVSCKNQSVPNEQSTKTNTTEEITVHIHEYGPDWENDGTTHWHTCVCGEKSQFDTHSYGEWTELSRDSEKDETTQIRVCSICGYTETNTAQTQHFYTEWEVEKNASCTETGLKRRMCIDCKKIEREIIPATGHTTVIDAVVEATCETVGKTEGKHCSVCNTVLQSQDTVSATGHNFVDGFCINCKMQKYSDGLKMVKGFQSEYWIIMGIGDCTDTDVVLPVSIAGLPVTEIKAEAFKDCSNITSILIPDGIKVIGDRAFYGCTNLKQITIPKSVTTFGTSLFSKSSIQEVFYNSSCGGGRDNVFLHEKTIKKITFNCSSIPDHILCGCTNITEIVILDNVQKILNFAFEGCTKINTITIPNTVITIGEGVFMNCSGLREVCIPDSVTTMGTYMFDYCSSLTKVTLPSRLTSITGNMFSYCTNLKTIEIPSSVTKICNSAFERCYSLESVTIPQGVTEIQGGAFYDCANLKSVSLPNSLVVLDGAFDQCTSLTNVVLPKKLKVLYGFEGCTSLKSLIIPDSVETIGGLKNSGISSIVIPSGVCKIAVDAFVGIQNISYNGTIEDLEFIGGYSEYDYTTRCIHCSDGDYKITVFNCK